MSISVIESSPVYTSTKNVVRMVAEDLDEVMAVEQGAYPFPWTRLNFLDCLKNQYEMWMLTGAETKLGHSVLSAAVDEAHLLNLTVHRDYQRRGLGRYLLNFNLQRARGLGAGSLFLEVRESNSGAYNLYLQEGFNEIGRRRAYYPAENAREDAIIMAIEL